MHKLRTMHLFAGAGGDYSQMSSSGISQCAQLSGMSIASRSYPHGRKTVTFHGFQFLRMCRPLMESHGEVSWTSWLEDFRVRTSVLREKVLELKERIVGSGERWRVLSARYDHLTRSWRTAHCLSSEALPWSSVTLPKWGMMRYGVCWELITSGLRTSETVRGSLLPTPTATPNMLSPDMQKHPRHRNLWATPMAQSGGTRLRQPTLNAQVNEGKQVPMSLNPAWVEWLMGWPSNWTDLAPLSSSALHAWYTKHSHSWEVDSLSKTADNVVNRHVRLKSIGNGQVPEVAAVAWLLLKHAVAKR